QSRNRHKRLRITCAEETGDARMRGTPDKTPLAQRRQCQEGRDDDNKMLWHRRRLDLHRNFENPRSSHRIYPTNRQIRPTPEILLRHQANDRLKTTADLGGMMS